MNGRIAIPIHNINNELVAYCGRATSEEQSLNDGKYKLPANFEKSREVYNLNRISNNVDIIIIVESYLSVWRLFQSGIKGVVAIMGSILSEHQEKLIKSRLDKDSKVILMFDNDESGKKCTADTIIRFGKNFYVKAPDYSKLEKKPHNLSGKELDKMLL